MTKAEVSAYEYAIIVSRSVQAKVLYLLCTLSGYIIHINVGISLSRLSSRVSYTSVNGRAEVDTYVFSLCGKP